MYLKRLLPRVTMTALVAGAVALANSDPTYAGIDDLVLLNDLPAASASPVDAGTAPWIERLSPGTAGLPSEPEWLRFATHNKPSTPTKPTTPKPTNPGSRGIGAVSGLPWNSGTNCHSGNFDTFRGRGSDVYGVFLGTRNFRSDVVNIIRGNDVGRFAKMPGQLVLSWPMLPAEIAHKFAECSRGDYDQFVTDAANALKGHGFVDPIIRLGFEANGKFTWSLNKFPDRVDQYKTCFQRQATLFRSVLPQVQIEWTNRRDGVIPYSIERAYPGDAYVDIIGMMFYDRWPPHPNQKAWDAEYMKRDKFGGPRGLGTYLEYARKLNKKLALAEWAVSTNGDPKSTDNAFYIEKMYQFFKANAADMAYDTYFNCGPPENGYKLAPTTQNPKAAAKYKELWSAGK